MARSGNYLAIVVQLNAPGKCGRLLPVPMSRWSSSSTARTRTFTFGYWEGHTMADDNVLAVHLGFALAAAFDGDLFSLNAAVTAHAMVNLFGTPGSSRTSNWRRDRNRRPDFDTAMQLIGELGPKPIVSDVGAVLTTLADVLDKWSPCWVWPTSMSRGRTPKAGNVLRCRPVHFGGNCDYVALSSVDGCVGGQTVGSSTINHRDCRWSASSRRPRPIAHFRAAKSSKTKWTYARG